MNARSIRSKIPVSAIAMIAVLSMCFQSAFPETGLAQTSRKPGRKATKRSPPPPKASPKAKAFFLLVSGKWAKITDDARLSMTNSQLSIAAIQCHSTKKLNITTATNITSISGAVSQKLSKILIYKKLDNGLQRIDFKTRKSILFPKLKIGKIRNGQDGFEISNTKVKITLSFGKIKQGNKSIPVMIEGKALFLKCPKSTS